ncbi:MarR family transcriptional regulator [Domibacillus epiphyticus]|uniref:MarR family transcriptional regulator n=2 Tax=Domibacillus epiphyticus TaxID=1714355 RepID=A0A1V2ABW3_9BACI|nr:MarR family transcriptional regulator [Domibacillus epiphyticus]
MIYGTERVLKSVDDPIWREYSPEQIQVMKIIGKHGPISSGNLAIMQGVHKSAISNRLKKLQEKELVQAAKSGVDQRTKLIELTKKGETVVHQSNEVLYGYIEHLLEEHVEEGEVEQFVKTFRKLKEILKLGEEDK